MNLRVLLWGGLLALSGCGNDEAPRAVGQLAWDRVELVAEAAEPVVSIVVREGQPVAAGAVILQLDPGRADAQVRQAAAKRRQAEARLAEIERGTRDERVRAARADLSSAETAFDLAQRELDRTQRLGAERLISPDAVDRARAERDRTMAQRNAARARLDELVSGATREELRQAEAALAETQAAERLAGITLERLTVRAPQPGRVDALPFEVGERPNAGAVVAVLLAGPAPYARVYVPEPVRARIGPGTAAQIFVDGIDEPFAGRVRYVSADPAFTPFLALTKHDRARLSFLAEIVLGGNVQKLAAGVPVDVVFAPAP